MWIKSLSDKSVNANLVAHKDWHVCCLMGTDRRQWKVN
ncbi:hypothetical protein UYSO10_5549 [Kosakonia radicincitans]|nr:hypothetical protein UYSO10_5549 [Kosakonia radicincitans]